MTFGHDDDDAPLTSVLIDTPVAPVCPRNIGTLRLHVIVSLTYTTRLTCFPLLSSSLFSPSLLIVALTHSSPSGARLQHQGERPAADGGASLRHPVQAHLPPVRQPVPHALPHPRRAKDPLRLRRTRRPPRRTGEGRRPAQGMCVSRARVHVCTHVSHAACDVWRAVAGCCVKFSHDVDD